jgi:hypothetical protein
MSTPRTRYVIRRPSDGLFFRSPTDDDPEAWNSDLDLAFCWVNQEAAQQAATLWHRLNSEVVKVVTLTLSGNGKHQYREYQT